MVLKFFATLCVGVQSEVLRWSSSLLKAVTKRSEELQRAHVVNQETFVVLNLEGFLLPWG
jgi:hypothetical protein